jgi:hypothetical protein
LQFFTYPMSDPPTGPLFCCLYMFPKCPVKH